MKNNGFPRMLNEDSNNLHNSSADLFIFYKSCMTQCLQLFTNSNLLCKLTLTLQKYLREYASRILSSSLPKLAATGGSSSYSSISGAATSLIQNFQIQNMLKESVQGTISNVGSTLTANLHDSTKKLNEGETCRICSILCTAEYCLETTQQVSHRSHRIYVLEYKSKQEILSSFSSRRS